MIGVLLILAATVPACDAELRMADSGQKVEATQSRQAEREALVAQISRKGIISRPVLEAMGKVPRHEFVPEKVAEYAYHDRPLPIGFQQTISQPFIVAYMTELLHVEASHKVLEIGTGSGYQAAVLAEMGEMVYSIEIVPELTERAATSLSHLGYDNVDTRTGDGYRGWPQHAPFDRIIVTAAAPEIPEPLIEQLAKGGRLVIPVDINDGTHQWIWLVTKDAAGVIAKERKLPVRFVPMIGQVTD